LGTRVKLETRLDGLGADLPALSGTAIAPRSATHSFRHGFSDLPKTTGWMAKEANAVFEHETTTTRGKIRRQEDAAARLAENIGLRRPITAALPPAPLHLRSLATPPPPFVPRHRPSSTESGRP
jgi:hypothetical protein